MLFQPSFFRHRGTTLTLPGSFLGPGPGAAPDPRHSCWKDAARCPHWGAERAILEVARLRWKESSKGTWWNHKVIENWLWKTLFINESNLENIDFGRPDRQQNESNLENDALWYHPCTCQSIITRHKHPLLMIPSSAANLNYKRK